MSTETPEAPKIEFPLDYPIKVIGDNIEALDTEVARIVSQHDARFDPSKMTRVPSRNGTFVSLRFSIWATGKDQLDQMHKDLIKLDFVKMVM